MNNKESWPNFFIVGAPKAGTTSMHNYLNQHPEIFMSEVKEPHYFTDPNWLKQHPTLIRDKKKYLSLFENVKNEKIIGESSAGYLADPKAAQSIHEKSANAHILICIRDPVERMFSHFLMNIRKNWDRSLHDEIQQTLEIANKKKRIHHLLNHSLYSEKVQRYLDIFGKNKVKIIIFEEFIKNPNEILKEIFEFLGLDESKLDIKLAIYNKYENLGHLQPRGTSSETLLKNKVITKIGTKILPESIKKSLKQKLLEKKYEKPIMDPQDIIDLKNYFNEDVQKLQKILGKKLPWKNFQD